MSKERMPINEAFEHLEGFRSDYESGDISMRDYLINLKNLFEDVNLEEEDEWFNFKTYLPDDGVVVRVRSKRSGVEAFGFFENGMFKAETCLDLILRNDTFYLDHSKLEWRPLKKKDFPSEIVGEQEKLTLISFGCRGKRVSAFVTAKMINGSAIVRQSVIDQLFMDAHGFTPLPGEAIAIGI